MIPVNLIGRGRIGAALADWLATAPGYRLQAVIGRDTRDWPAAPLTIDTAGPAALRAHGPRLVATGEVWTVGAAALIDPAFRNALRAAARHPLRLFTPWIAGPALAPPGAGARLHIAQSAPGLAASPGLLFRGPLAEAARAFPDHLNTATAAALTGPGIEATTVEIACSPDGGTHAIRARYTMPSQTVETAVSFGGPGSDGAMHPVTAALIAALARRGDWLRYG
jgi:aspartate dehydrogenase